MSLKTNNLRALEDPEGPLEQAFIDEFLRTRGYEPGEIDRLPTDQRMCLLKEASAYAAGRLTEVEARAHYLHRLHGEE